MAVAEGRQPYDVKFFSNLTPILGRTLAEAQDKHDRLIQYTDWEGGLACVAGFTGLDLSKFPLDEPFSFEGLERDNAVWTMLEAGKRQIVPGVTTPRELGKKFAFGGFRCMPVGTPEMVVDIIKEWIEVTDIDGFIMPYISNPESYEDIVELLCPVLQERGIMWKNYAVPGGTFRENLRREPGTKTMPEYHHAAKFRYANLKGKYADKFGDIVIDRWKEAADKEAAASEKELVKGVGGLTVNEMLVADTKSVKAPEVRAGVASVGIS